MTLGTGVLPDNRCRRRHYIDYGVKRLSYIGLPCSRERGVRKVEGRKLQLTGGSTFVDSLPKRWVTDAGLKAGDTVFLEPQVDGAVQIRARPMERPGPDLDRAVHLGLQEHGVPGLEPGVRDPSLRQGVDERRTASQLKLTAFHFPHSTFPTTRKPYIA